MPAHHRLLAFATLVFALPAHAVRNCTLRGINESGFVQKCADSEESPAHAISGDAYPTLADAMNLNPASIPTHVTPYGIETIGSFQGSQVAGTNWNVAVIRGFGHFGTALATNSDNTFYSSPYLQQTAGASQSYSLSDDRVFPTMNLGAATDSLIKKIAGIIKPVAGVALRYNKTRGTFGYSSGLSLGVGKAFALGASFIHEPSGQSLSGEQTIHLTAGLTLDVFQADLTYALDRFLALPGSSDSFRASLLLATGSVTFRRFGGTLGYKRFLDTTASSVRSLGLVSLYTQLHRSVRLAYLYNYVPGAHSLGAQILFF